MLSLVSWKLIVLLLLYLSSSNKILFSLFFQQCQSHYGNMQPSKGAYKGFICFGKPSRIWIDIIGRSPTQAQMGYTIQLGFSL